MHYFGSFLMVSFLTTNSDVLQFFKYTSKLESIGYFEALGLFDFGL